MIGTAKRYAWLAAPRLSFPHRIKASEIGIDTEREFIEFLIRNDWVQRRLGIKMTGSNGLFPDIFGEIYDNEGGTIAVEIEYHAESYRIHGHSFKGCDLIISLTRGEEVRFVKGVPVWSFYYRDGDELVFCLDDDINYDFSKHGEDGD